MLGARAPSQQDTWPGGIDPWGEAVTVCVLPMGNRTQEPPRAGHEASPCRCGGPTRLVGTWRAPACPGSTCSGAPGSEEDAGRGNASPKGTGPLTACRDGGKPELSNPTGIPGCV